MQHKIYYCKSYIKMGQEVALCPQYLAFKEQFSFLVCFTHLSISNKVKTILHFTKEMCFREERLC